MRDILFKAKRTDNGEWVEGDLQQDRDLETAWICGYDYYTDEDGLQREPYACAVSLEALCQYTGLTDKNGNKIWENDIVKSSEGCLDCDNGIGNIDFYSGLWYVNGNVQNSLYDLIYIGEHEIEVIGNVFDNNRDTDKSRKDK